MLHDTESDLYQKLLVPDIFPGMLSIADISVTKYATTVKKCFFGPTLSDAWIGIYGKGQFSTLIFVILNA